jgi:predicted alpha/beta hydrolase family esterase
VAIMPRRRVRTAPVVLLHGLGGPGPEHWYTWLAGQLSAAGREVHRPGLPNPDEPVLAEWLAALRQTLAPLPDAGFDLAAHSAGALLWLHHAAAGAGETPRPARVALAGLPDRDHIDPSSFRDVPLDADAVRQAAEGTVLIGGDDDPTCPAGIGVTYGAPLRLATTVLPGAGHLNPASGYGPWPAMLDWCNRENLAFY